MEVLHISLGITSYKAKITGKFLERRKWSGIKSVVTLFNIEAKYVDLTGVDPSAVGLYYVNDNGEWEKMKTKEISVKIDDGIIKIVDAEIPHFSRYAIGWGE